LARRGPRRSVCCCIPTAACRVEEAAGTPEEYRARVREQGLACAVCVCVCVSFCRRLCSECGCALPCVPACVRLAGVPWMGVREAAAGSHMTAPQRADPRGSLSG